MLRPTAPRHLPRHPLHPSQLYLKLLNHQFEHPHRLMILMPHLTQNRSQRLPLSNNLALEKRRPPLQLQAHACRPRLPGQRQPGQERRPLPLRSPLLPLQSIRQSRPPLRRSLETTSFRSLCRRLRLQRPDQPRPRQFLQRIINLRPRNPRPIPYLSPLQFRVGLIPMHRPLRQQTQKHQIRSSQIALRFSHCLISSTCSLFSLNSVLSAVSV